MEKMHAETAMKNEKNPTVKKENLKPLEPVPATENRTESILSLDKEQIKKIIQARLEELKDTMSAEDLKLQEKLLTGMYLDVKPVSEVVGVTKGGLEYMYSTAYNFYNAGKYKEAMQQFQMLLMLDEFDLRYAYGLAASYHMNKEYLKAIAMYLKIQMSDHENPVLSWHIADCYRHLGMKMNGYIFLLLCRRYAGINPIYEPIRFKANAEIEALEAEFDKEYANTPKSNAPPLSDEETINLIKVLSGLKDLENEIPPEDRNYDVKGTFK